MDKWHKEVVASELKTEKKVLNDLKKTYDDASKQIDDKIAQLLGRSDANMQHVIYQVQYQQALKKQVDGVLDTLNGTQFTKVSDYLQTSYEEGFVGTMYTLQKQGVPLMFPIDQEQVTKAVINNSKISEGLYKKLGIDVGDLKKAIRSEISRGISTGASYADMARNVNNQMNIGLNKSIRIARTEGHRISQESRYDAMKKAKDAGADVVKQWDSTLDKRTRPHHQALDGQIRELDEPFEVAGRQARQPAGFGVASEDINCRCVILEIGRWELDEDTGTTKMVDGEIKDFSNVKDYEEFKQNYWNWTKEAPKIPSQKSIKDLNNDLKLLQEEYKEINQKSFHVGTRKYKVDGNLTKGKAEYIEKLRSNILKELKKDLTDGEILDYQETLSGIDTYFDAVEQANEIQTKIIKLKTSIFESELKNGGLKNYKNSIGVNLGTDLYDDMHQKVVNCSNRTASKIWKEFEDKITVVDAHYKGTAHCEGYTSKIYIDVETIKETYVKNQTFFHESGHAIDFLAGQKRTIKKKLGHTTSLYISIDHNEGEFYHTIKSEVDDFIKLNGGAQGTKNAIKKIAGDDAISAISDIFDGATNHEVRCNWGHKGDYWIKEPITDKGVNPKVSKEAFAHMVEITFSNPKQLAVVKQILPKSYKVFEDIIDEIEKLV